MLKTKGKKLYVYKQLLLKHILKRCKGSELHEHLAHYTYIVVAIAKFTLGIELGTEKQALPRALNEWLVPPPPCLLEPSPSRGMLLMALVFEHAVLYLLKHF